MTIALRSRPSPVYLFLCVVIAGVVIRICVTVGTVAVSDSVATGALGRLASLPAGIILTGATPISANLFFTPWFCMVLA